jgi:hypothetical protein
MIALAKIKSEESGSENKLKAGSRPSTRSTRIDLVCKKNSFTPMWDVDRLRVKNLSIPVLKLQVEGQAKLL